MITSMMRRAMVGAGSAAGRFLQDAAAGLDSIDIIVLGDSNAQYPATNGYTMGWHRAMQFGLRVRPYGTAITCGGMLNAGATSTATGLLLNSAGIGMAAGSNAQGSAAGSNAGAGVTGQMIATSSDTEIAALRLWLGMSTTNWNVNDTTNALLFPNGWGANPAVVETSARYTSAFDNYVGVSNQTHSGYTSFGTEFCFGTDGNGAGVTLHYRLVHGTFNTAGNFTPVWYWLPGTGVAKRESSPTSTGGGYGYATKTYTFSPTFNGSSQRSLRVSWDGFNSATTSHQTTGPFAALWQSVMNPAIRGYSVSTLNYFGGLTTAQIASKIENCDKLLDAFLKEIRERQQAAQGTGRALVWLNSGVNGSETASTWTTNAQKIVDRISARWASTGGNPSNLAFVFSVTHPKTLGSWSTNRAAVAIAANDWGHSAGNNVSVIDIGSLIDGPTLAKYLMYQDSATDGGQSHLATVAIPPAAGTMAEDGYAAITQAIVASLIASA